MYYQASLKEIEKRLFATAKELGFQPILKDNDENTSVHERISHILWMIDQMCTWSTRGARGGRRKARKAARWVGWIYCAMEELGRDPNVPLEWTGTDSRNFVNKDTKSGHDWLH